MSRSFEVDNTPPRVEKLQVEQKESGHRIRFRAVDDSSAVSKVEYAIDSGRWIVVYPEDGICDSPTEEFDISLPGYREGVHTMVIKVTDLLGNAGTSRQELR